MEDGSAPPPSDTEDRPSKTPEPAPTARSTGERTLSSGAVNPAGVRLDTTAPTPPVDSDSPTVGTPEPGDPLDETEAGDKASTETPEEPVPSREAALADRLLNSKIAEINKKSGLLEPHEQNLRDLDTFRNGNSQEFYNSFGKNVPISLQIPGDDGSKINVLALAGDDEVDNLRVFSCYVEGEDKPVPITGEVLAKAHLAQRAESIAENFKGKDADGKPTIDTPESRLVTWRAKGEEDTLPSDEDVKAVQTNLDADPFLRANEAIATMVASLKITLLDETLPPEQRAENETSLAALLMADALKGGVGQKSKIDILKGMIETAGPNLKKKLEGIVTDLEPQHAEALESLVQLIENSGQTDEVKTEWFKLAAQPEGLYVLLADNDFMNLPDMHKAMYGKDLTTEDAMKTDKLIKDFERTHPPRTGEQQQERNRLIKYGKATGKSTLWILAAILGAGALTVAGVGMAAAGSAKGR